MNHYIRCNEINMRVSVSLLRCNFKFTGTLIFISAVTGTGALATGYFISYNHQPQIEFHTNCILPNSFLFPVQTRQENRAS